MLFDFDDHENYNLDFLYVNSVIHPQFKTLRQNHKVLAEELITIFIKVLQDSSIPLLPRKILFSKFLEVNEKDLVLHVYSQLQDEYKQIYQKYFLEWQFTHNEESLLDTYKADKKFRKINNKRSRRQPEIKESNLDSLIKSKEKQNKVEEVMTPLGIMRVVLDNNNFPFA